MLGIVLATVLSTWHKLKSSKTRKLELDNAPIPLTYRQVCGVFLGLMIHVEGPCHCGQCLPEAGGPGVKKKKKESQLSNPGGVSQLVSALVSASKFPP